MNAAIATTRPGVEVLARVIVEGVREAFAMCDREGLHTQVRLTEHSLGRLTWFWVWPELPADRIRLGAQTGQLLVEALLPVPNSQCHLGVWLTDKWEVAV